MSFLSNDISAIRDEVNAIAKEIIGDKLLELPQERALFDMSKPWMTQEEFASRVASLGGVVTAINKPAIGKFLKKSTDHAGSLMVLEDLLATISSSDSAKKVCDVFKGINALRQAYPIHGDNVSVS